MRKLKSLGTAALILALFCLGVWQIDDWMAAEGRRALEHELEQAAEHCYAAEGRYPPDLDYIEEHYGVRTGNRRYTVEYRRVAPDRAPEIIVKRKEGGAWA
ncbi:MAG: hypothetical protein ACI4PV_07855 [Butyricicoccus sp.]